MLKEQYTGISKHWKAEPVHQPFYSGGKVCKVSLIVVNFNQTTHW